MTQLIGDVHFTDETRLARRDSVKPGKKIFVHKKALLHFHVVRDFLTSEILAGQMFTLELMDVALK